MLRRLKKTVMLKLENYFFKRRNPERVEEICAYDFRKIQNERPSNVQRIAFVVPEVAPFGGGITSIFRLGSGLSRLGYSVTYVTFSSQNETQLQQNASLILNDYQGEVSSWENGKKKEYDIVIATDFTSVYYAVKLHGYKCIFVQDFEPFFFEAGDNYLLASRVYQMGFHLITLGTWCKEMIQKNIQTDSRIDSISFPYEPKEYRFANRDYRAYADKKVFTLCVYIRQTPRRLPIFCQYIVGELKKYFERDGRQLKVLYFGEEKRFCYEYGKCLGKLTKKELNELYANCDFGMVASFTNISLVPYEMMATGLPIIEYKAGSFEHFFGPDDAFLYDFDCAKLYDEMKSAIESPEILEMRNRSVQEKLAKLSWDKTIVEFSDILENISEADLG